MTDDERIAAAHITLTAPLSWKAIRTALDNLRMVHHDVPGGVMVYTSLTLADGTCVGALISCYADGWQVSDGDQLWGEMSCAGLPVVDLTDLLERYRIAACRCGVGRMVATLVEVLSAIDDVLAFQIAAYAYALAVRDAKP